MGPRDAVPARRMDPLLSPLHGLVVELSESDSFRAFAEDFPVAARVSEPALPLVLASLHETLARPLLCLLPEDEQARDAAEAVAWYGDPANVALLPTRGVRVDSGLEPPAPDECVAVPCYDRSSADQSLDDLKKVVLRRSIVTLARKASNTTSSVSQPPSQGGRTPLES